MDIETLRALFLWSAIANFAFLLLWFLFFTLAHDRVHRVHSRWFRLTREQFDAIHYAGMAAFKLCIMVFNIGPLVALCIVN